MEEQIACALRRAGLGQPCHRHRSASEQFMVDVYHCPKYFRLLNGESVISVLGDELLIVEECMLVLAAHVPLETVAVPELLA